MLRLSAGCDRLTASAARERAMFDHGEQVLEFLEIHNFNA